MTVQAAYLRGVRLALPFLLVLIPFGMLFGVMATGAGLNLVEVMGFSILVVAGAAQFAALQMMADNAPTVIILVAALAVNLRMAMYSAALTPYLGKAPLGMRALIAYLTMDQNFAICSTEFPRAPELDVKARVAMFIGSATPLVIPWYLASYAGATLGKTIPPEYALDFALPITFIAMIAPMLRTLPNLAAATVSVVVTLLLAFLPYNLGLLVAAVAAMLAGAGTELWLERRRAA